MNSERDKGRRRRKEGYERWREKERRGTEGTKERRLRRKMKKSVKDGGGLSGNSVPRATRDQPPLRQY